MVGAFGIFESVMKNISKGGRKHITNEELHGADRLPTRLNSMTAVDLHPDNVYQMASSGNIPTPFYDVNQFSNPTTYMSTAPMSDRRVCATSVPNDDCPGGVHKGGWQWSNPQYLYGLVTNKDFTNLVVAEK